MMLNVPRTILIGIDKLGYREREVLYMTPRKFGVMLNEYIDYHGHGGQRTVRNSIDALP